MLGTILGLKRDNATGNLRQQYRLYQTKVANFFLCVYHFTYGRLITENYNRKQKWQYRNIMKLFLLVISTISAHTRSTELKNSVANSRNGVSFWDNLYNDGLHNSFCSRDVTAIRWRMQWDGSVIHVFYIHGHLILCVI
jgi:hypothetical protein